MEPKPGQIWKHDVSDELRVTVQIDKLYALGFDGENVDLGDKLEASKLIEEGWEYDGEASAFVAK